MNIYLLRHAVAAARDPVRFPDDSLRPLTARGKERARKIAKVLKRLDLSIDLMLFSPLLRTRQTAKAVAKQLALRDRANAAEELAPDGDPRDLFAGLARRKQDFVNLLLVGHEPYLSDMLSVLISGRSDLGVELEKGGLAKLDVTGPLRFERCATLVWLLPSRIRVD